MSLSNGVSAVFTIVAGSSSDMAIIVYLFTMFAHRKYRQSSDYIPNGFKMPGYKITSPLTIAFFVLIFGSLFLVPDDRIGAVGSLIWSAGFLGFAFLKQKRSVNAES